METSTHIDQSRAGAQATAELTQQSQENSVTVENSVWNGALQGVPGEVAVEDVVGYSTGI